MIGTHVNTNKNTNKIGDVKTVKANLTVFLQGTQLYFLFLFLICLQPPPPPPPPPPPVPYLSYDLSPSSSPLSSQPDKMYMT